MKEKTITKTLITILIAMTLFITIRLNMQKEKQIVDLKNQILHLEHTNENLNREIWRLRHQLDNLNTIVDIFIYDIKEDFLVFGTRNGILY